MTKTHMKVSRCESEGENTQGATHAAPSAQADAQASGCHAAHAVMPRADGQPPILNGRADVQGSGADAEGKTYGRPTMFQTKAPDYALGGLSFSCECIRFLGAIL